MATATTALSRWLETELRRRSLSQMALAARASVGVGTISGILHRGHIPKIETLFRLADTLDTSRERVLRLAADLPPDPEDDDAPDDYLIPELLEEFRQLPDEWKLAALEQVETLRRLAERPPVRIIGGEEEEGDDGQARSG
ncbi:MAG: helix-turn-helix transcriptional regulator [Anaerolineae bacterium]|jgi:transcriptional regulator with XRE-family HTH domain